MLEQTIQIDVANKMHIAKLYAEYWLAMATTGAATRRNLSRGREPNLEEKSRGEVIGWVPLTDEEKIDEALQIALSHIDKFRELSDRQLSLLNKTSK